MIFCEPCSKARVYGDFRDLIRALRDRNPMINEPEVRALIADQLESPKTR
jgi:hypothetical protein